MEAFLIFMARDSISDREPCALKDASTVRRGEQRIPQKESALLPYGAHRDVQARELIEARGAELLFLPAYSPDLNPIEAMWSKVKAHLRQAKARTHKSLLRAIRNALAAVSDSDAKGFFRHAGYVCTIS
jgi:hypothetical protein